MTNTLLRTKGLKFTRGMIHLLLVLIKSETGPAGLWGASQFRALPVAAGILPAGESGIHAPGPGVAGGGANESFIAWQEFTVSPPDWKPGFTSARMADATVASDCVSCDRKKLRRAQGCGSWPEPRDPWRRGRREIVFRIRRRFAVPPD